MCRKVSVFLLALVVLLWTATLVPAGPGLPPSIQDQIGAVRNQVSTSDVLVVGKVKAIEEKTVVAGLFPTDPYHYELKVAVIAVEEMIVGPKDLREVRVAFRGIYSSQPLFKNQELAVDQEACFGLKRHYEKDFYVSSYTENKTSPNYERNIVHIRQAGKCLRDTLAGLKSKEPDDRLVTAALLIGRYRTTTYVAPDSGKVLKTEPIDAEESKLIMNALADADWKVDRNSPLPSPVQLFQRLGVTVDDGWSPQPANFVNFYDQAKTWVKDHADSYRIKKIVFEDAPKK